MSNTLEKFKRRLTKLRRHPVRHIAHAGRHPYAVPGITFMVLLAVTAGVYFIVAPSTGIHSPTNEEIVIISHDHEQQIVPSREPTVGALLRKLNIKINQGDVVEPDPQTAIKQADFRINIYRAVPVEIIDGTQKDFTFSAATTPRAIVDQSGTKLYPADIVTTAPSENFLSDGAVGEQVVIDRATPVNVNLYGTPLTIRTHAATVGALIKEENIHLAATDQVLPSVTSPITAGAQIFIVRVGTKINSVSQSIAMPIQTIPDPSLAFGTSAVRQQGSAGTEVITYQQNLQNGVVVGQAPIQTVVTQQPVTEIVVEGTSLSGIKGDMALAGIAPGDYNYADYIISHESGWCPTKAQGEHTCPAIPDDPYTTEGYGLCQATPGTKMASAGADWETNPVTQLRWCAGYAASRYGSWAAAYNHWIAYSNW